MVGKLLIVDDVATNRIVLKVRLAAAGYRPLVASDGATALALARAELPDLILLDPSLQDMPGTEMITALRQDALTQGIPVIVATAHLTADLRLAAFAAGADAVLRKPVDEQLLLARIRNLMRQRGQIEGLGPTPGAAIALLGLGEAAAGFRPAPARLALVSARPDAALRLRRELGPHLPAPLTVLTPDEALAEGLATGSAHDLYLIDGDAGAGNPGLRLMSDLQSRTASRHAAFAVLTGEETPPAAMALDLGAQDVIEAGTPPQELALRLLRLVARKREMDRLRASVSDSLRLAMIDPLTGLHNRRYAVARLGAIAEAAHASGMGFAVMVADIDRFKSVNDRWGHAAGDAVLVEVAARLTRALRTGDLLARIGGEEFLAALPDVSLAEARGIAERLCQVIEGESFALPCGSRIAVTVSIGLAIAEEARAGQVQGDQVRALVDRADRALMASKSAGRNQVTVSRSAA